MQIENKKKHYLIYQTTNLVNNKIYIGKHITENIEDNYFGSGKYLRNAINKHGLENFEYKILFELQNEEEMNLLEKCVVTQEFCDRKDTYNINVGGDGGWDYVNNTRTSESRKNAATTTWNNYTEEQRNQFKKAVSHGLKERIRNMTNEEREQLRIYNSQKAKQQGFSQAFKGKTHTIKTKQKISNARQVNPLIGENNSMYGKHWYHNPETNEHKPFFEGEQPDNWVKGLDPITSKAYAKNLPHKNVQGKIQIYNPTTDELKFIFPNEPIPEGFQKVVAHCLKQGNKNLVISIRKNKLKKLHPKE